MNYLINVIDALSRVLNALLGGESGETLSARAYRCRWALVMRLINAVVFWQDDHCRRAYEYHRRGGGLPVDYQIP